MLVNILYMEHLGTPVTQETSEKIIPCPNQKQPPLSACFLHGLSGFFFDKKLHGLVERGCVMYERGEGIHINPGLINYSSITSGVLPQIGIDNETVLPQN